MHIIAPSCIHFYFHDRKRENDPFKIDICLTAGFSSPMRWDNSDYADDVIVYGLTYAELYLEMNNAEVDQATGDLLSTPLNTSTQVTISRFKGDESSKVNTGEVDGNAGTSETGVRAMFSRSHEQKSTTNQHMEVTANIPNISGILADPKNPFWVFKSVDDLELDGAINEAPVCTVKVKQGKKFSYTSGTRIRPLDVKIIQAPVKKWKHLLREGLYPGLREQKLKKILADSMCFHNHSEEENVA